MEASSNGSKLFTEFEPVPADAWKARILADLKGADYDKALTRSTYEGITTQPFYAADNTDTTEATPGNFPFTRGKNATGGWLNTPVISTYSGTAAAIAKAKEALAGGADALEFSLESREGLNPDELIAAIDLTTTPVQFYLTQASVGFAQTLLTALAHKGISANELKCRFFFDPLTELFGSPDQTTKTTEALFDFQNNSQLQAICVNGAAFYNAGASLVQELAFTLSAATEYAHLLTENGVPVEKALQGATFRMAVGTNYFMEIAKLRALRQLWSAVVTSYGAAPEIAGSLTIQSVSASWHQSLFDPHTNMLRATTEAMSAIIGGCDVLTLLPYNSESEATGNFASRIARNISTILKEESYFGKVADPAAGSYYVESLTEQLTEKVWALFTEIETTGGYLQAAKNGLVQQKIEEVKAKKVKSLATRKEQLIGTNQFANTLERLPEEILSDSKTSAGSRASTPFDLLRLRTLAFVRENAKTPKAHLVLLGNSSMRKARADFAQDFFALAGFEAVRTDVKENIEQLEEMENTPLLVLCASDEEYQQYLDSVATNLKAIGKCNLVMVAGNPANLPAGTDVSGVDGFVYMGADAVEVLTTVQMRLGII